MGSTETKANGTKRRSRSTASDAFVILAMTLTTVALAIGLYLQFRLAFWLAVVAALSVYVGLLALHVLVRRSERVERLTAEIQRLETELSQVAGGARPAGGLGFGTSAAPQAASVAPQGASAAPQGASATPQGASATPQGAMSTAPASLPGVPVQSNAAPSIHSKGMPAGTPGIAVTGLGAMPPRQSPTNPPAFPSAPSATSSQAGPLQTKPAARLAPPPAVEGIQHEDRTPSVAAELLDRSAERPGMSERAVDAIMNDYWAFRPALPPRLPEPLPGNPAAVAPPVVPVSTSAPKVPHPAAASPAAPVRDAAPRTPVRDAVPPPIPAAQPLPPSSPRQSDVEMIGGLIKKMADEINAVEAGRLRNPAGSDRVPPAAIEASVNALRTTADQMRGSATNFDPTRGSATNFDSTRGSATTSPPEPIRDSMKPADPRPRPVEPPQAWNSPPDHGAGRQAPPAFADGFQLDASRKPAVEAMPPAAATPLPPPLPSRQAVPSAPVSAARHAMERPAARVLPSRDEASRDAASLDHVGSFASLPWPEANEVGTALAAGSLAPSSPVQPTPVVHSRLAALAEAITAGRLDVLLDPILGLADQRARHFEVSVRLRDKTGNVLEPPDGVPELRESGLLPLLDCARIQRSAQVATRLADRGKPGALFSAFSGESLSHDQFLADFADLYSAREGLSAQLVLSFGQADVRAFAARDWDTIAEMHELGFRFALQSVTDLDFDLEALKAAGFDFVKLDASVFLDGMPASGGVVPAADICRHLAQLGMTLIVGQIDDEAQLARIFGFGVIYGQGQLFGGARPMKSEALAEAGAGHAAA